MSDKINDGENLELVSPREVFMASRNENGELTSVKQKIPGRDQAVNVIPAPSGFYEGYLDPVPWDDNEKMAHILNERFPGLDTDAEEIEENLLGFSAEVAIELIHRASGRDMHSALAEQRDQQGMVQMMDALGIDTENATLGDMLNMMSDIDEDDVEQAREEVENNPSASDPNRPKGPDLKDR